MVIVKTQPKQKSVRNGKRKENAARKNSTRNAWRLAVNAKQFQERGAIGEKKAQLASYLMIVCTFEYEFNKKYLPSSNIVYF